MKKLSIILGMALFAVVALSSCKDDSGQYVEQLYTNLQKTTAIKQCLVISADSAFNHLCTYDGFYNYEDGAYRIDYSSLQNTMFDTLNKYGYGAMADSLILITNRMAESCGTQLHPIFADAIDTLKVYDYDVLIKGDMDAITHYFALFEYGYLKSESQSPVSIRMSLFGVNNLWSDMLQIYHRYSSVPLNFDIQNYVVEKMLDGLLQEMRVEEALIRTDSTHRTEVMEILGRH